MAHARRTRPRRRHLPTTCTRSSSPRARAIDGLEKALSAVGLLDEALAIDLRRPQDYFERVWSTVFRAHELARHENHGDADVLHDDDDAEAS
ncbi:hypothetical protein ABZS86_33835 [Streptomyces sp. NPDC005355]|uniref:hypothetical protein n=1 Tax=Streptomyces sp. NPDC005355 TaxID=3157038 RepID=UPI0033AD46FE